MSFRAARYILAHYLLSIMCCFLPLMASAAISTDDLIEKNIDRIVQVEIYHQDTGKNRSYGSAFFINADGLLATNYHVISSLLFYPNEYSVRIVNHQDEKIPASVVDFDIVNDLALLQTELSDTPFFTLASNPPNKGQAMYSIGNPLDLGMVVAEGNYNGLIEQKFVDRINLSGALNPGMSGGPTISERSEVVGINVTSRGNQMSGLVPVDKLVTLFDKYTQDAPIHNDDIDSKAKIAKQLLSFQQRLYAPLLESEWVSESLGDAQVLGKISDTLSCATNSNQSNDKRTYERLTTRCRLSDFTSLNSSSRITGFWYSFELLKSAQLNTSQMSQLLRNAMKGKRPKSRIHSRDVTNYHCDQSTVSNTHNSRIKTSFCIRAYRHHKGLYDVLFSSVLLDGDKKGLISKFGLNAISEETATAFTNRFLENIKWN